VDEGPSQLGLPAGEEVEDEVLLHVEILVEHLAQRPLIDVLADPHHRELEETGHGRRQGVRRFAVLVEVDEHGPAGQLVEHLAAFVAAKLPAAARPIDREGPNGQFRDEVGLALAEQHLENAEEQLGGRCALGVAVQPVGEPGIS